MTTDRKGATTTAALLLRLLLLVSSLLPSTVVAFEPVTTTLGVIGVSALLGYSKSIWCSLNECCTDRYIPADVDALHRNLSHTLYGQHIVVNHLIPALRSHYGNLHESGKPLVLSFHGTPGTGKNFVADRVAEHLYRHGARSAYVKKYLGRLHFPEASRVAEYARNLHADITAAIAACPRSLFIFDEVDKTPPGVFDRLASLMDHHSNIDKLDYRQATYIFLSNAGGLEIAERLLQHLEGGALRAESRLADYDAILTRTAYNEPGGLKRAAIIEAHLIDHYVPFLPLEREHVEACIRAEFRARGKEPSAELVASILKEQVTYQWAVFSTTGCKRLNKLIGMHSDML